MRVGKEEQKETKGTEGKWRETGKTKETEGYKGKQE